MREHLPEFWTVEADISYGNIITARLSSGEVQGFITVDERLRAYSLGVTPVRHRGAYAGRGWKADLYRDAVKALKAAVE